MWGIDPDWGPGNAPGSGEAGGKVHLQAQLMQKGPQDHWTLLHGRVSWGRHRELNVNRAAEGAQPEATAG